MHPATMTMPTPTNANRIVDQQVTSDERTYAMLVHLTLLITVLPGVGALAAIVVALVMWLVKRHDSTYIDDHGREALNFQISLIIYSLVFGVLGVCSGGILLVFVLFVFIFGIVGMIMAAVAANRGEYFRYPATIRFLH